MKKWAPEYWITNISKQDIGLSDLNVTIRARTSINLLDKRHYNLTLEQIEKSLVSGSLYRRRDKIFKRQNSPEINKENKLEVDFNSSSPSRSRSVYEIETKNYEELMVSDEQFAEQNIDTVEIDQSSPIIKKV